MEAKPTENDPEVLALVTEEHFEGDGEHEQA
jgi:hypothetical protein